MPLQVAKVPIGSDQHRAVAHRSHGKEVTISVRSDALPPDAIELQQATGGRSMDEAAVVLRASPNPHMPSELFGREPLNWQATELRRLREQPRNQRRGDNRQP